MFVKAGNTGSQNRRSRIGLRLHGATVTGMVQSGTPVFDRCNLTVSVIEYSSTVPCRHPLALMLAFQVENIEVIERKPIKKAC